jgi:hypothetical protein
MGAFAPKKQCGKRGRIIKWWRAEDPAYLSIGRHLAAQGIAPPNAPELLTEAQRHRTAVNRHLEHTAELARLSSRIDKQELRKFYFSVISILALLAIILPVVFQSPPQREWLPQETDAILSLNVDELERDDLPKRWHKEQPAEWDNIWNGLIGPAAKTPGLKLSQDVTRITRALTTDQAGKTREFILVDARRDVSSAIASMDRDKNFDKHVISGLPFWERPDLAVSRVGPNTLAVGASSEVSELVRVRLGMESDLKITGQLFDRFQALDRESALRLITRDPPDLARIFQPIFVPDLLQASQLFGLALSAKPAESQAPLEIEHTRARVRSGAQFTNRSKKWLRLEGSDLLLYAQSPEIQQHGTNLEVRFTMPEGSARALLERIAKTTAAPNVATQ